MGDTALSFSYKNQSDIARASRFAHLADTTLQVGSRTLTTLDPLGGGGAYDTAYTWYDVGVCDGEANWDQAVDTYKELVGSPVTTRGVIKSQHTVSGAFSFKYLTYQGLKMANGNADASMVETMAATGQDTVASGTDQNTTVLTTGTNISVGELFLIGTTIKQLVIVEAYDAATKTVTHNKLSATLTAGITFEKIKTATLTAAGIKFTLGGAGLIDNLQFRILRRLHPSKYMVIEHIPQGVITPGKFTYMPQEPLKCAFSVDAIDIGNATNGPTYGYWWIIPQ